MADRRRVIAYTMHEHERNDAEKMLEETHTTEGYVVGEAESAVIDELRKKGLVIKDLGPADDPALAAPASAGMPVAAPDSYVVVRLRDPLLAVHREEITRSGLELTERLGARSYVGRVLHASATAAVNALRCVENVSPYKSRVKWRADAAEAYASAATADADPPLDQVEQRTYEVVLHERSRYPEVEAYALAHHIPIVGKASKKLRVEATASQADHLNDLDAVSFVEEYVEPRLLNDRTRALVGVTAIGNPGLTGAGEVIGVADTGIDQQHPVFSGRVSKVIPRGRPNDASDPHGHGTHVSATIVASSGSQTGVAPGATVVFQSVMDAFGKLSGLPTDLNDLFDEAYREGVRIHNNSWGSDLASTYTVSSLEVDEFVHAHKDMLVVIAAGNAGSGVAPVFGPRRSQPGFVEWASIGAPATSKNALVVGASRSDRTSGGHARLTYRDVWPNRFADLPTGGESVSGDPESIAAFSSRGPCNDQRIKPDVVAPGTDTLSAKSSTAAPANFAEVRQIGGAAYGFMSGTSMAAPVVSGLAALVREWLRTRANHPAPSAALLKAIIINGTRQLSGASAIADHGKLPNLHQGFGAVAVATTLPLDGTFTLAFVDPWQNPAEHFNRSGMSKRYRFTLAKAGTLRITMAYTDVAARNAQNDVSIILEKPDRTKQVGNENGALNVILPDPNNNVEVIRIDNAPAGDYLVKVVATTIMRVSQDYALVVAGPLASPTLTPA